MVSLKKVSGKRKSSFSASIALLPVGMCDFGKALSASTLVGIVSRSMKSSETGRRPTTSRSKPGGEGLYGQ